MIKKKNTIFFAAAAFLKDFMPPPLRSLESLRSLKSLRLRRRWFCVIEPQLLVVQVGENYG